MDAPREDPEPDDRRLWRWRTVFAAWSVPVLLTFAELLLGSEAGSAGLLPMLSNAAFWYGWALATPAIFGLTDRRPPTWPPQLATFAAHCSLALLMVALFAAQLATTATWMPDSMADEPFVRRFLGIALGTPALTILVIYALVATVGLGLRLRRREHRERRRTKALSADRDRLARCLAEARLEALQRQLQPHFLFNTLHAIAALMDQNPDAARRMTARLATLLRASLEAPLDLHLDAEIDLLESYLDVERVRFGNRLTVDYTIERAARGARVPSFLLQPLVENAIRHGRSEAGACRVRISAVAHEESLKLTVCDDGPGLEGGADQLESGRGIGISNTRARLAERYGESARLTLRGRSCGGVEALIELPLGTGEFDRPSPARPSPARPSHTPGGTAT